MTQSIGSLSHFGGKDKIERLAAARYGLMEAKLSPKH
jgi:hypothetical protein